MLPNKILKGFHTLNKLFWGIHTEKTKGTCSLHVLVVVCLQHMVFVSFGFSAIMKESEAALLTDR